MLRRPSSEAAGRFREACFGAIAEFRRQGKKGSRLLQQRGFGTAPTPSPVASPGSNFVNGRLELDQART